MLNPRTFGAALVLAAAVIGPSTETAAQSKADSNAARAFKKAFRNIPKRASKPPAQRESALGLLGELDSEVIAKALIDAWREVDGEITAIEAQRDAAAKELDELIGDQAYQPKRQLPTRAAYERVRELQSLTGRLRGQLDGLRDLRVSLTGRIAKLESESALKYLVGNVIGNKKMPLPLKVTAARAAGGDAVVLPDLHKALKRAKKPPELIAVLDALGLIGRPAKAVAPDIIKLLGHKAEAVRERAALALSVIAVPAAIEPMIDLLARERGMAQQRVAGALEVLTGQQFGIVVGSWRRWLEAEGAEYTSGAQELGKGEPSLRKRTAKNYYMGIPQDGKGIVYVIDSSGSMKKVVNWKTPSEGKTTSAGGDAGAKEMSRLEACKGELIDALGRLEKGKKFNIVWYSDLPHIYQDTMVIAGKRTIPAAQDWVRKLQPNSMTNIHDAMQVAFGQVGRGVHDKYYGVEVDTIFLLTDGSPTKPDGSLDSTEKIIQAVREWNALQRITIHTIGIGDGLNVGFMRKLAEDNGGQFKKF